MKHGQRFWVPAACAIGTLLAACSLEPDDLCRPETPSDTSEYVSAIELARTGKQEVFRRDPGSPVPAEQRESWPGLEFYPVDPKLRFRGPLVRKMSPRTFTIVATNGDQRPAQEAGYFDLKFEDKVRRLPVFELLDSGDSPSLFVPFLDTTTGNETYPAGRYINVESVGRGEYRIDFNEAYNPSCAYGGSFSCPIAPESNRLDRPIEAGERGWHDEEVSIVTPD